MTELSTAPYRIDFASNNAFIGAWLKRNTFSRRSLGRFLLYSLMILCLTMFGSHSVIADMFGHNSARGVFLAAAFALISLIFAAILTYILAPAFTWLWQALSYAMGPLGKRHQTLRVTDTGIEKAVDNDRQMLPWDGIFDVVETKTTVLVFTSRNCAMIVPKAAFAAPEEATAFAEAVVERAFRRPHPDAEKNF